MGIPGDDAGRCVERSRRKTSSRSLLLLTFIGLFWTEIAVAQSLVITSPQQLPNGSIGVPYSVTVTASGGSPPYTWSTPNSSLPAGLTLNASSGLISGIPTFMENVQFFLSVTDSLGAAVTQTPQIIITGPPAIQTATLLNGVVGIPYSQTLQGSQGLLPYTWTLTSGQLPPGLVLNSSIGAIAGTPTTPGIFTFSIQMADSSGRTVTRAFSVSVTAGLTITTPYLLKALTPGNGVSPYSQTLVASGGTPPYTWSTVAGSLPSGITLTSSTGVISGQASTTGTYGISVQANDSSGQSASKAFTLEVDQPVHCTNCSSVPNAIVGQPYNFALQATGGTPPYNWAPSNDTGLGVPGITLSTSGVLAGTPGTTGTFNVFVTVRDSGVPNGGIYGSECCGGELEVEEFYPFNVVTPLAITNTSFPTGTVGVSYNTGLTTSGGLTGTQTWSLASGALPDGLSIRGSSFGGVQYFSISGTPSKAGTYNFVLQVTASGATASKAFSITIINPLQITTTSLPGGTLNAQYMQVLAASGGVTPYVWSLNSGSLPPGLNLNQTTGTISGTPTQVGSFPFTVGLTDSGGNITSQSLTIVIGAQNGLSLSLSSMSFSATTGGGPPPAQMLTVGSTGGALSFTATTSTPGATPTWLMISSNSGTTPATLTVSVNTAGLAANTYNGSITIASPTASNSPQVVNVSLTVSSAPVLILSLSALNFTFQTGGAAPPTQSVSLGSSGEALTFSVAATNSGGAWLSATPSSGTTPATLTVSVSPAGLTPGVYNGTITVTASGASNGPQSVSVTLNVTSLPVISASPTHLNFTYQVGGTLPPPQAVHVSGSAGLPVTVTTSGGAWLSASPMSTITPASLAVSVSPAGLSPGLYAGAVTVNSAGATNSPQTVSVALTVTAAAIPAVTNVVNAASYTSGPVAPGEVVSISGTAVGPAAPMPLTVDVSGKISTLLGGVQVLFNGIPAPIIYASASQTTVVVPYEIAGAPNPSITVRLQGHTSNTYSLKLASAVPALFTINGSGTGPAAILNQDNSMNSPGHPAPKGSYVTLYMTGEGQTNPPGATGQVTTISSTPPLTPQPLLPVNVEIDGQQAVLSFLGEAPGVVSGVMQITLQIPPTVRTGELPITVSVGGNSSQNGVTVSVR